METLRKRIAEINKQIHDLMSEKLALEKELTQKESQHLLNSGELAKVSWKMIYPDTDHIWASVVAYYKPFSDLFEWDHDTREITPDVLFGASDGSYYLASNALKLAEFCSDNKLQVDTSSIDKLVQELWQKIDAAETYKRGFQEDDSDL